MLIAVGTQTINRVPAGRVHHGAAGPPGTHEKVKRAEFFNSVGSHMMTYRVMGEDRPDQKPHPT